MSDAAARARVEEGLSRIAAAARAFASRSMAAAGVDPRELVDPDGEAVASLVDVERAPGAASLAQPIDLLLFETWVLGHLGDRDELDLDVNSHQEVWFGLGAWIGETLRARHGGFWLFPADDPRSWRIGFTKILLEIAPHAFAEKLIRSGPGMGKRMVAEIDRLRQSHEEAAGPSGKLEDRYTPQHYARLHTVPLAQWLVLDMARLQAAWAQRPAGQLREQVAAATKKLPPQNAAAIARVVEALAKLEADKPAAAQTADRGLYEAVAQLLALRRATAPIAVDVLEKVVLPALHVGIPDKFPPLGADDVESIRKGTDLFAVYVDVVPYAHPSAEGGLLGAIAPEDLGSPYPDRTDLELGRGDWIAVNPARLRPLFERFDPKRMLAAYEKFVAWVAQQPGAPRVRDAGDGLARTTAAALADLRACVAALDKGSGLVFRLLPPPA